MQDVKKSGKHSFCSSNLQSEDGKRKWNSHSYVQQLHFFQCEFLNLKFKIDFQSFAAI